MSLTWLSFAEIAGEPVGFALTIPNFNEALRRAQPRPGVPEALTMLQLLWHWKIRRTIKGVRMPLMGVKKQHRNKGVELGDVARSAEGAPAVEL